MFFFVFFTFYPCVPLFIFLFLFLYFCLFYWKNFFYLFTLFTLFTFFTLDTLLPFLPFFPGVFTQTADDAHRRRQDCLYTIVPSTTSKGFSGSLTLHWLFAEFARATDHRGNRGGRSACASSVHTRANRDAKCLSLRVAGHGGHCGCLKFRRSIPWFLRCCWCWAARSRSGYVWCSRESLHVRFHHALSS